MLSPTSPNRTHYGCNLSFFIFILNLKFLSFFLQLFKQAIDLCLKGYGEKHLLTTRIYLNTGIAYEMHGDTQVAYDFFVKLKAVCMAVSGFLIRVFPSLVILGAIHKERPPHPGNNTRQTEG